MKKVLLLLLLFVVTAISAAAQGTMRTDFRQNRDTAITNHIFPSTTNMPHRAMSTTGEDGMGVYGTSGQGVVSSIGSPVIPVIMVAFSDLDFLSTSTPEKISRWLNETGYHDEKYAVGSVADYFRFNSDGLFNPTFEVTCKVTLSGSYKDYGKKSGKTGNAVKEALSLAEAQGIDFSKYATNGVSPIISIVHAGPGAQEDFGSDSNDYVWAHFTQVSYSTSNVRFSSYIIMNEALRNFDANGNVTNTVITGVGTFCHEFSHALGLPDTYDVNGATNGTGSTPGFWDIMDYQFMMNGYMPMEMSAYERSCLGWLEVEDLPQDMEATYTLAALNDNSNTAEPRAYRIVNPKNEKEYFILENHQKSSWYVSSYLGTGMLVWHVDYNSSRWNSNRVNIEAAHQLVSVVPADGVMQYVQAVTDKSSYPGDLFPGKQNVIVFDSSVANYFTGDFTLKLTNITETEDGKVTFTVEPYSGGTTAVSALPEKEESTNCYNLQGQQVSGKLMPGVYIRNGKKYIQK